MPDLDAMVILQHEDELPEDRYVNTLHFSDSGAISWQVMADDVGPALVAIYAALDIYADYIQPGFEVRCYNPDDLPPRQPSIYTGTIAVFGGGGGPAELALVLSFRTGVSTPRSRGRIYLGPFHNGNVGFERPPLALRNDLLQLASDFSGIGSADTDWQVVSRVAGTRTRVEHAWVDDAWDVQRRRGIAPLSRVSADVSG